jgi:hypothetical protein
MKKSSMKKINYIFSFSLIAVLVTFIWLLPNPPRDDTPTAIATFKECVATGAPVMESYPRQCRYGEQNFVEGIGNEIEKANFIRISSPRPNQLIHSPLTITGEARGSWFFEASFPVTLVNWDGLIIAQGIAQAKGDWMTTEFVPFEATLTFTVDKDVYSNRGALILKKDNPSGLPEHDDALEIPIVFQK